MLPMFPITSPVLPINRLDTLFDRMFDPGGSFLGQGWTGAPIAMWEDDDKLHIEVELPGMTDKDVEVTIDNRTLYLRGERKAEEGRRYLVNNRGFGKFEQVLNLPESVDPSNVQADLKDGILRIDLPKSPEARPHKIAINAN